jgi:hypothetical protein
MNQHQHRFAGRKQFKAKVKGYWNELAVDPLHAAAGTRAQPAERIQEPYGISNEEAALQLDGFLDRNRDWDLSHR